MRPGSGSNYRARLTHGVRARIPHQRRTLALPSITSRAAPSAQIAGRSSRILLTASLHSGPVVLRCRTAILRRAADIAAVARENLRCSFSVEVAGHAGEFARMVRKDVAGWANGLKSCRRIPARTYETWTFLDDGCSHSAFLPSPGGPPRIPSGRPSIRLGVSFAFCLPSTFSAFLSTLTE